MAQIPDPTLRALMAQAVSCAVQVRKKPRSVHPVEAGALGSTVVYALMEGRRNELRELLDPMKTLLDHGLKGARGHPDAPMWEIARGVLTSMEEWPD